MEDDTDPVARALEDMLRELQEKKPVSA